MVCTGVDTEELASVYFSLQACRDTAHEPCRILNQNFPNKGKMRQENESSDLKSPYKKNKLVDDIIYLKDPDNQEVNSVLKSIRIKNLNRIIIATLNVNSICGKFEQLKTIVTGNIDILVLTESKLDDGFPSAQFLIEGFSPPYRHDRNRYGGGILIYIREDIPSKKLTKHTFPSDIEGLFIEINLRKTKWLLFGSYHPPSQPDQYYFDCVSNALDIYNDFYDKFLLIGDFNAEDTEPCLGSFLYQYDAKNLVKGKTCFKNPENPSCVDLFLTNSCYSFQNTSVISTGLSDFHKMPVTVLKTKFVKNKPKEITYRDYKKFYENGFREELKDTLLKGCANYKEFEDNFLKVLEKHAPLKTKLIRANHAPYITKNLRKSMMRRSQLETKYYKTRMPDDLKAYRKQKNFVSRLYKKEMKKFYQNLNLKTFIDNKNIWKNIKPLFSEKGPRSQRITIVDGENIFTEDKDVSELFNICFRDAVHKLDIQENVHLMNQTSSTNDPIESAIEKYNSRPSILKIKEKVSASVFNFKDVCLEDV